MATSVTVCLDIFRKHHHELCTILDTSPSTLTTFTGKLYSKKLVDVKTKREVLRTKGYQGADTLLDHLTLKLEYDNNRYRLILELILQEEVLKDLGERMKVGPLPSATDSSIQRRLLPDSTAVPVTDDAISFAKHLKSSFDEVLITINETLITANVGNLLVRLNTFFSSETLGEHSSFLDELDTCKTAEKVLLSLIRAHFIGYLNYKLLEVFIKAAGPNHSHLKSCLVDYNDEYLKLFQCKFQSLIQLFRNPVLTPLPPVTLPDFTIRLGPKYEESSLYTFKEFFENRFLWAEHLLILDVVENCILIKYGVLPFFVSAVVRDLTDPTIIKEFKKEDIIIELSPQLKEIARHEQVQPHSPPLLLCDMSSSDVTLFLRSHDLAITDRQKSQLLQISTTQHIITDDDDGDKFHISTVVSEDGQSLAEVPLELLKDLPEEKLIDDWDKHGEKNSSSGFHEDLQSLDLHIKEDASLAEKNFIYEKALKQLIEEQKKNETKIEMHKKMIIELNELQETNEKFKAEQSQYIERESSWHSQLTKLKKQNELLFNEIQSLNDQLKSTFIPSSRPSPEHVPKQIGNLPLPKVYLEQHQTDYDNHPPPIPVDTVPWRSEPVRPLYHTIQQSDDHPSPTVSSMFTELEDLMDWERLAHCVPGITKVDIRRIKSFTESSYYPSSLDRQKVLFFDCWLSHHPNLTWNDVIDTLMKAGEYKLAIKVDSHFSYNYEIKQPLTLISLTTFLHDLVEWEQFAIHLPGIANSDIQKIGHNHHLVDNCKHALFKYWLRAYPNASWNYVVDALGKGGKHELAKKVMKKLHGPHPLLLHHELKKLDNWEKFGLQLPGILSIYIEHIKSQYDDLLSRKLALYHKWMSVCTDPSWEEVVGALARAGEHELALKV